MKTFVLLALVLVSACASAPAISGAPTACDRRQFGTATPYDSSVWRALEGVFRIYAVDTVNDRVSEIDRLELAVPDSAARSEFTKPRMRIRRGVVAPDSVARPVPQLVGFVRAAPTLRFDLQWRLYANRSLVNSCPDDCVDDSPTVYSVTHLSNAGFFGEWSNPMIGIVRLYDPKTKRTLTPPSGYFCAIRRDDA